VPSGDDKEQDSELEFGLHALQAGIERHLGKSISGQINDEHGRIYYAEPAGHPKRDD